MWAKIVLVFQMAVEPGYRVSDYTIKNMNGVE